MEPYKYKVSVIIPVYNVEKYLRRCVDSVLNQTYKNIEVILVDDGSPDGCPLICDAYAQQDNRVKVIHKINGGLSSARNAALDYSLSGDFITFVDSDDWINPDTIEYSIGLIKKYDAECVSYEVNLTDKYEVNIEQPDEIISIYTGKDVLQHFMLRSTTATGGYSMCTGLFKRNLLDGIRFREGKINEDIDYKFKVMQRCERKVVTNQAKYYYFQSGNTMSSGGLKIQDFQLREAADLLCDLASEESYGNIAFLGRVKKARTAFSLLSKIAYYGIADKTINKGDIVLKLIAEHRRNLMFLLKAPIPLSRKVLAIMLGISFNMTERIIHLLRKI